jgi:dihydrofolate reductase
LFLRGIKAKKAEVFTDLKGFVGRGYELAGQLGAEDVMVIGGAQLYRTLMPHINRQYITQVHEEPEGDAHFEAPDPDNWRLISEKTGLKSPQDEYDFVVQIWDRVSHL